MASQTTRVVPLTNLMTADSERRVEGIACDLPSDEAEALAKKGLVAKVVKSEVPEGAAVVVTTPAATPVGAAAVPAATLRAEMPAVGETAKVVKGEDVSPDAPPAPGTAVVTGPTAPADATADKAAKAS